MNKFILDACCGGRMFWKNKNHPNALFIDNRVAKKGHIQNGWNPNHEVKPDIIMDFRSMAFADKSFKLVVFDPPHLYSGSEKAVLIKKYGLLDRDTWTTDIQKGFQECLRVLEDYGVLIFKWQEANIPLKTVLDLFPIEPLFGTFTGKGGKTKWMTFMKIPPQTGHTMECVLQIDCGGTCSCKLKT